MGTQATRAIGDPLKMIPDYGKRCDIMILREDEHIGFRDYALAFLDIFGFLPSDAHAIETIYHERDIEERLPSLMERYPGARVIYDETGTCGDALVPADAMAAKPVYTEKGEKRWHAVPNTELALGKKSREYITSLLQIEARTAVDDSMSYKDWEADLSPKFDDKGREAIAQGMAFGRLPLAFRPSAAIWSPKEGYVAEVRELISSGLITNMDDEWRDLVEFPKRYAGCVHIWKEALTAYGIPLAFVPSAAPGDISPRADGLMEIGRALGIDAMIDAYLDGVPIEDILS